MDFLTLRKKLIEKDFGNMNAQQFRAVTTVNGPLLVLAGAGSGKTTVLVNRIANLVKYGNAYQSAFVPQHTDADLAAGLRYLNNETDTLPEGVFSVDAPRPWQILAITFTNKAAGELRERINARLGAGGEELWAGTFHAICGKILRRNADYIGYTSHFTIYDTDDQRRLMKQIMKQEGIDEKFLSHKAVLAAISSAKDELVAPEEYEQTAGSDPRMKTIARLYRLYRQRLCEADAMDFDDMIVNTVRLLEDNPDVLRYYGEKFRYIMVDEYQDTNHAQYVLVSLLAKVGGNLCVVGDDDQSIYRFRGATIENILSFEDGFPGAQTVRLEQNYRSTGNILNAANAVIRHNVGRKGKELWTDQGDGEQLQVYTAEDEKGEARYIADGILEDVRAGGRFAEHAILYRMNAQSAALENVFARSGVPYRVIGGFRFFERKEVRDVLAYLNLVNNHSDDVRLRRIINEPKRGIGETTVGYAAEIAGQQGISLYEVFSHADEYAALSRAAVRLKEFCAMIDAITDRLDELSLSELFDEVLEKSGYRAALLADGSEEGRDRLDNVNELGSTVRQYELENDMPALSDFLEEIALVSDTDALDGDEDKVVMMTVHSAKGLEFDRVYLIGMEEGIFPGNQSIYGGEAEMEEERRLAYVAITRARKRLTITNAATRMLYGTTGRNLPSRFLKEIPDELCRVTSAAGGMAGGYYKASFAGMGSYGGYTPVSAGRTSQSRTPAYSTRPAVEKPSAPSVVYTAGMQVEHTTFGAGMILSVRPMGNDTLLEIAFEQVGTKKLMANYAKLKIL